MLDNPDIGMAMVWNFVNEPTGMEMRWKSCEQQRKSQVRAITVSTMIITNCERKISHGTQLVADMPGLELDRPGLTRIAN